MSQKESTFQPIILGSGRAGHAIARSLAVITINHPELKILPPIWAERDSSLKSYVDAIPEGTRSLLCISNPHGLHADSIVRGHDAGFDGILCEKPSCVSLAEVQKLRGVDTPTAIFHGYRQTWGLQTLKSMWDGGSFGEIICVEGRYWQSSTAERALSLKENASTGATSWKNDIQLSGPSDVYLDIGSHWIDAVSFLFGDIPRHIRGWRSYVNAESAHRDSHSQIELTFPGNKRAMGSISKTVHGATNHFEIHIIGAKRSAAWSFLKPDEIVIGEGRDTRTATRKDNSFGSGQPSFHGMGWLEGYIDISYRLLQKLAGQDLDISYPDLASNLNLMDAILKTEWAT